jgi:ABC-type uncharacterized transport system substrate-binding protein
MTRKVLGPIAILVLASANVADAQKTGKIFRVGVLTVGTPVPLVKGLRDGLKEAGYVDGNNLFLDISAKENYNELRPTAKVYVDKKFDLIVLLGGPSTLIAMELTQEIPIVFVGTADPIGSGLVKSFSRPEANVTGVAGRTDRVLQKAD